MPARTRDPRWRVDFRISSHDANPRGFIVIDRRYVLRSQTRRFNAAGSYYVRKNRTLSRDTKFYAINYFTDKMFQSR